MSKSLGAVLIVALLGCGAAATGADLFPRRDCGGQCMFTRFERETDPSGGGWATAVGRCSSEGASSDATRSSWSRCGSRPLPAWRSALPTSAATDADAHAAPPRPTARSGETTRGTRSRSVCLVRLRPERGHVRVRVTRAKRPSTSGSRRNSRSSGKLSNTTHSLVTASRLKIGPSTDSARR